MKNEPEIGFNYVYFDKDYNILGVGTWQKNGIRDFPGTCGCNGINKDDVEAWHPIPTPFTMSRLIRRQPKKEMAND